MLVALEGDARGPIRIGANSTAQAWSDYFTQTIGVPEQQVHRVSFAGIGRKPVQVALDSAAMQVGQGGHLWVLFIGRGRVGCPSSSPAGIRCEPQLWLEMASADQDTPEPREWGFKEMQGYVAQRSLAPVMILDVVAGMPKQTDAGTSTQLFALPPPPRGVTLALIHPVEPSASIPYTYPTSKGRLKVGIESSVDVTWPLALAGRGVLPGTAGPAFSQLLLSALRGWGDRNADGSVTPDEGIQQVRDALAKAAPSLSGVPEAMGPDRTRTLVPVAERDFPTLQAPEPQLVGGHSVLFNAASRVLPPKGPSVSDIDWHMFDDIGDTSGLSTIPRGFDIRPEDFADRRGAYEALARPIGDNLKKSYEKHSDAQVHMRIEGWCGAGKSGWLAPFRHDAWRHCASFVSYASAQLLVWSELENDWRHLDELLRKEATQSVDGFAMLRHLINRYPMLKDLDPLDALETTCQRIGRRRARKPPLGADLGSHEWIYVPGAVLANVLVQPAFEIQRTEVTNAQYNRCVQSGACTKVVLDAHWSGDAEVDPRNGEQAVVGVNWDEGRTFCRWAGGDLPTISEWDHAARASDGAPSDPFAWTHGRDRCSAAVIAAASKHNKCRPQPKGPSVVCSKPQSNSPLGLCDMVGNVSEWVDDTALSVSSGGKRQSAMGHNWANGRVDAYTDVLPLFSPIARTNRTSAVGFRCVRPTR